MVMRKSAVVELARDLLIPEWQAERNRLDLIDMWHRWNPEHVAVPPHASKEHKDLRDLAETPWLSLVVTSVAQQLQAELIRSTQVEDVASIWGPWLRNRMPSRQRAIHRAALVYGYSYTTCMPGDLGAVIRGRSPRDLFALYEDPVVDEYPQSFIIVNGNTYTVVDEEAVYTLQMTQGNSASSGSSKLEYVTHEVHGVGVAPAIRYSNQIDLEGRTPGEVEPYVQTAKRINKTAYDRMLTQHFNSWKVRYATGLDMPDSEQERESLKLKLRQNDILTGEEGVEFGSLDETPMEGFIKAEKSDIEALAAVSQTPAYALTGQLINLSADAIAEARSMLNLKANERKIGFGDSHAQTLRLAAFIEGRERDAADFTLSMQWADLESRSMTQAADALGKLSTMLGIPPEKLWDRIPTVTAEEAKSWLEYKQNNPNADAMLALAMMAQNNGSIG